MLEILSLTLSGQPSLTAPGAFPVGSFPTKPHPIWPRGNCNGRCGMLSRVSCLFQLGVSLWTAVKRGGWGWEGFKDGEGQ